MTSPRRIRNTLYGEDPKPNPWDEEFSKGALGPGETPVDVEKIFSPRAKAKARLTRKLKAKRNYAKPVRGGTGKQYRTRRNRFSKSDE